MTQQEQLLKWYEKRIDELGGRIAYDIKLPNKPAVNLHLTEKKATDNDMAGIPQVFPDLTRINLRRTQVTDLGVARLQGLQKLTGLDLSETAVTDKTLELISGFPTLTQIKLQQTKITDEGLRHLGGRSWTYLLLSFNEITNRGLELLMDCKSIGSLDLNGNPIDDDGLRHLAKIKGLKRLSLGITPITDIQDLAGLSDLEYLYLNGTEIKDDALDHLKALPRLRTLYIINTKISPEAIAKFRKARPEVDCTSEERKVLVPSGNK